MSQQPDMKKRLALAVIDFLSTSVKDGTLPADDAESIEIATNCIAETFKVDPSNKAHMTEAIGNQNLLQIYGVYDKLKNNTKPAGAAAASSSSSTSASSTANKQGSSPSATNGDSELLKSKGNAAMQRKDYTAAIEAYSSAITIAPTNPIYLSNRAAAYSAAHQHDLAVADAELAVVADPSYTKAWSRLGLAKFVLGDARGSMEAYEKGIAAEGNGGSDAMKKGYRTAKDKVEQLEREGDGQAATAATDIDDAPGASRAGGGMPDLSALAGMMGGGGGGMPDMASLMNNPMLASMAQNLMQNPQALQGLMQNPQMRAMAERFGVGGGAGGAGEGPGAGAGAGAGAGGGMPDLSSLMNDPNIAEMARNFMGGGGGGAGGAPGAGSGAGGAGRRGP